MSAPLPAVSPLAETTAAELHGTKAATLAQLQVAGIAVPPGLVIPTHATAELDTARDTVCDWAEKINADRLIVRSSATNEDGTTSSFAGIYRSRFTPAHPADVHAALREIRDSLHSALARSYSSTRDQPTDSGDADNDIALLVQPALRPIAAGVLVAEIVNGRLGDWRIELVRGLAEPLMSGHITGEIHTGTGTARAPHIHPTEQSVVVLAATAEELTVPPGDWLPMPTLTGSVPAKVDTSGNGLVHLHTPPDGCTGPILTPTARGRLLALTRTVARTLDLEHVDIEWALNDDGTITVLQARPLTTGLPPTDEPRPDRTGLPAAPGIGSGPVVHLQPGLHRADVKDAVLVCGALDTDAVAMLLHHPAALISTTGGPLSHTAIIARELSIPCVTNVTDANTTYPPGTTVHVDGTTGRITTTTPPQAATVDDDLVDAAVLATETPGQQHNDSPSLTILLHKPGQPLSDAVANSHAIFQPTCNPGWVDDRPGDTRDFTLPGLGRLRLPTGVSVPRRIVALTPQHRIAHQRHLRSQPRPQHIVWDWNGTVLDDNDAALAGVNALCRAHNTPSVTLSVWRTLFQRPARTAYERLLQRPLSEDEWQQAEQLFHVFSQTVRPSCRLAHDAELCLERWRSLGGTQSVLSMTPHDELIEDVAARNLTNLFTLVQGRLHTETDGKAAHLRAHLADLGLDPAIVAVIGDSEDDAAAAHEIGVQAVLCTTGTTSRARLDISGHAVVDSLTDALNLLVLEPAQLDDPR